MSANPPSLWRTMNSDGNPIYYNEDFRAMLEYHLQLLRNSQDTYMLPIDPGMASIWAGDFYGLLCALHIPKEQHYVTMRVNGMTSPTRYQATMVNIQIPSMALLTRLISLQTTVSRTS